MKYQTPEIEIIRFDETDIIRTSSPILETEDPFMPGDTPMMPFPEY